MIGPHGCYEKYTRDYLLKHLVFDRYIVYVHFLPSFQASRKKLDEFLNIDYVSVIMKMVSVLLN